MMNRKQLASGNIEFQDFAASCSTSIGQFLEVPMNCWGSVVARYQVISITAADGQYITATAKPV